MTREERAELDLAVEAALEQERLNPLPGRHQQRWDRIYALDNELRKMTTANLRQTKPSKELPPYKETPEWKALVYEYTYLDRLECAQACEQDWPIWQRRQHFVYLTHDDQLREAEVIRFDLDNNTIDCTTWPRFNFQGYLNAPGARQPAVLDIQQLYAAQDRLEELAAEKRRLNEIAELERERTSLPLFAHLFVT